MQGVFNDIHVQPKLIAQIKSGKPIIVITKELTPKTKQSIIDAGCKQFILIEEANGKDTKNIFLKNNVFNNVTTAIKKGKDLDKKAITE